MDEFYTINQTAIILKVHPLTIRRYIRERKLKAYRVGGTIRISVNNLKSFTQNFIPRPKHAKTNPIPSSEVSTKKSFTFDDPILRLRGKGLSLPKI